MYLILRCPPARTVDTLRWAVDNIPAGVLWTPMFKCKRRISRTRKTRTILSPAMPGYVFCTRANYLKHKRSLHQKRLRPLCDAGGKLLYCKRGELETMRAYVESEGMAAITLASVDEPAFAVGELVKAVPQHPWLFGRAGRVVAQKSGAVTIDFGGLLGHTEISPFLLTRA